MNSIFKAAARTLLLAGLILQLCSCDNEEVKYFRSIFLNGYFEYEGINPVHESQVKNIKCYRLIYKGGQLHSVSFLNKGRPAISEEGFATKIYGRAKAGVFISNEDQYGTRQWQDDAYQYELLAEDARGTKTLYFLDRAMQPTLNGNVASVRLKLDANGRREQSAFYDQEGHPTRDEHGVFAVKRIFDEQNRIIEQTYYDVSGNMMSDNLGSSKVKFAYDEIGNLTEVVYCDHSGKPVDTKRGTSMIKWKYDNQSNRIQAMEFDRFGNQANNSSGYSVANSKYNDGGLLIVQEYFNAEGKPVMANGFARTNLFYGKKGYCTKQVFFGITGSDSIYQVSCLEFWYDQYFNVIEQHRLNEKGVLIEENGIAVEQFGYDGAHNQTSYRCLDAKLNAVPFQGIISKVEWDYNSWGDKIESRYFDRYGNLCGDFEHVAITRSAFEDSGKLLEVSYFDSLNAPINNKGVAISKFVYDKTGVLIDAINLDKDGNRVSDPVQNRNL